jgi:hypothetical protein
MQMPKPGVNPLIARIRNAYDYRSQWLRVFLYGSTRSGKTTHAASFPRPFLLGAPNENGVQSLAGGDVSYFVPGEIDMFATQKDMEGFLQMIHHDMTVLKVADDGGAAFRAKWGDTFIWDSVTHYADAVINALTVVRENPKDRSSAPRRDPATGAIEHQPSDQQTWGALRSHLTNIRDILFRLPCHVVITALDAQSSDEKGNVTWQGPRVQGAAGDLIPSSCELVGFCDSVGADNFVVYFQKVGKAEAGTRLRGMRPQMLRVGTAPGTRLYDQLFPYLPQAQAR